MASISDDVIIVIFAICWFVFVIMVYVTIKKTAKVIRQAEVMIVGALRRRRQRSQRRFDTSVL